MATEMHNLLYLYPDDSNSRH